MLVSFKVGNFRSIKDPITLSMENKGIPLKNSYIYGANASGKSNLIKAISYMSQFVINSAKEKQSVDNTGVEPFLLDAESEEAPSMFEIIFINQGTRYRYGFELDKDSIYKEWLYYVPQQRETILFKRNSDNLKVSTVFEEGKAWEEAIDKFGFTLRKNALFISTLAQLFQGKKDKETISSKIIEWFATKLIIMPAREIKDMMVATVLSLAENRYRNEINTFMHFADTGIQELQDEIKIEKKDTSQDNLDSVQVKANLKSIHTYKNKNGELTSRHLDLLFHESDGSRKIFALSGLLFDAISNEKTLIIDEFSARLHPVLSKKIIQFFNQCNLKRNSQLIIVTHDISLLKDKDIKRNQIWLTEKDDSESTMLKQMSSIKGMRKTDILDKKYSKGDYGAIPDFKKLNKLTPDSFKDFFKLN